MKRSIKKLAAFVLALALMLQIILVPDTNVFAAGTDFVVEDSYISDYTGKAKNVTVPSNLGVYGLSFFDNKTIETLVIPEGFTDVTLFDCDNLKKVTLPSTVSSLSICFNDKLETLDLSAISNSVGYVSISENPKLTTITGPEAIERMYIDNNNALETLDLSKSSLGDLDVTNCSSLKNIKMNSLTGLLRLKNLSALEKVNVPEDTTYIELSSVSYLAVEIKNNKNGYYISDDGLYQKTESYSNPDETVTYLKGIDGSVKVFYVEEGTDVISYLGLSEGFYSLEEIIFPDSVTKLDYEALAGGYSLKKLTLPKNLISLQSYAFAGINIDSITLPASIRYVSESAFGEYNGKIALEKSNEFVTEYESGIYTSTYNYDGSLYYRSLIYYPKNKTSVKFMEGMTYIGTSVFNGSAIKKLDIPEGVDYLYLSLWNTKNLTSISIPSTVEYIGTPMLAYAPAIKSVSISADNPYYTSYKNCIYDKGMTTLYDVPQTMKTIEIPEGVVSLAYYAIQNTFDYDEENDQEIIINTPTVLFPRSLENFNYFSCGLAKVYADSPIAQYIANENYWRTEYYGQDANLINYVFRDSNKDLLNMIYVVDTVEVKKGKKETATIELPTGLNAVSKLKSGKNTECLVKFKSSNKKVAKVDSKTGEIKGVKKGTCTVNVECTIKNGKKKTTKKFKIKVKVK